MLRELKKFKVQTILVSNYKKGNHHKIFHLRARLIASVSDIQEAFKSIHQRIMTKMKYYADKDWIILDVVVKHSIKVFQC